MDRADAFRSEDATLAAHARSAELELYALETRLGAAQAQLAALRSRSEVLARERATVSSRLAVARSTLRTAEHLLAAHLRALYERGETDPLAVVLGADSLEEAMTALDGLEFAAEQDRAILDQTLAARTRLARFSSSLRARSRELGRLVAAAAAEAATLDRARAERAAFLRRLEQQRQLTETRIAAAEASSAAAESRTLAMAASPPKPALAPEAPVLAAATAAGTRTLTVSASGYSIVGVTATGLPTGWGVVAVDPSVIPLGTRMTIPGYGEGVAADTGGAVQGAAIDLWFPSQAEALAWGRRTVTISLN